MGISAYISTHIVKVKVKMYATVVDKNVTLFSFQISVKIINSYNYWYLLFTSLIIFVTT